MRLGKISEVQTSEDRSYFFLARGLLYKSHRVAATGVINEAALKRPNAGRDERQMKDKSLNR